MSGYCTIDEEQKAHILKLIDFLFWEIKGSGGDGDALWYSHYYNVLDIMPLIEEYNSKLKFPWKIRLEGQAIHWGDGQEWATITNDENLYKNAPSWQQILIKW